MNALTSITIGDQAIRMVSNLYSLNDLHKASGGNSKHRPNQFLRNEQTQALIAEIDRCANSRIAVKTKRGGDLQGTYVAEELVTAYAMWIDAAFALKVIRTFKAKQTVPLLENHPVATTEQKQQVKSLVNKRVHETGVNHQTVWNAVFDACGFNKLDNLTPAAYERAMQYFGGAPKQAAIENKPTTSLSDLPHQIAAGNGYPMEVIMPIWRAIKARIDENSLSAVDNSTSIYQRRWMGYFDGNGVERVHFIDKDAYVMTAGQFSRSLAQGVFSKDEVEDIVFRGHQFLMGDSQHRLDAAKPKTKSFIEQLKGLHPLELLEIAKDAHMQAFMSTPVPQAIAVA